MQGRGTLVKYDGSLDHYGDFLSDSKHGMGVEIRDSDKKFALVGAWQNDKLEGEVLISICQIVEKLGRRSSETTRKWHSLISPAHKEL